MINVSLMNKLWESKNSGRKVEIFLTSGEKLIGEVLEMRFYLGIKKAAKKVILLLPCEGKGEGKIAKEISFTNIEKVLYAEENKKGGLS